MRWVWLVAIVTLSACGSVGTSPRASAHAPATAGTVADQLSKAAARGDADSVVALLEAHAVAVDEQDAAAHAGHGGHRGNRVDTVRALIEAEANVDIQDNRLDNPFLYFPARRACSTSCA